MARARIADGESGPSRRKPRTSRLPAESSTSRERCPTETWARYVREIIDILARTGRRGFAFNVLSLSSDADKRSGTLYYADAAEMLSYCLHRYGRSVALLQDYGLYEFTVVIRHIAATR